MARRLVRILSRLAHPLLLPGVLACLTVGCNPASNSATDPSAKSAKETAEEGKEKPQTKKSKAAIDPPDDPKAALALLDNMVAAYAKAQAYEDSGEIVLHEAAEGRVVDQTRQFSVSFQRPNKLRLHVFDVDLVCDGETFWATLGGLPGQVLKVKSPPKLTMENIHTHPTLGAALTQVVGGSVQLSLLIDEKPLELILRDVEPKLLADGEISGEACRKVEIKNVLGSLVFWIDGQEFLLRKLEFKAAPPQPGETEPVSAVSWTATFQGARFSESVPEVAFQYSAPKDAVLVRMFDVRPPLSRLLGEKIGDFKFKGLDGKEISRAGLEGKVAIIDFWGVRYPIVEPHWDCCVDTNVARSCESPTVI